LPAPVLGGVGILAVEGHRQFCFRWVFDADSILCYAYRILFVHQHNASVFSKGNSHTENTM
jgi:hypothetical protein